MSASKYPGHGQNIWTEEQRLVLHLLQQFHFSAQDRVAIFNHLFDDYLRRCGVTTGLSVRTLHSQYGERHRNGRTHLWRNVLGVEQARRDDFEKRILTAAVAVGATVPSPAITSTRGPKTIRRDHAPSSSNNQLSNNQSTNNQLTNNQSTNNRSKKTWKGWAEVTGDEVEALSSKQKQNGFNTTGPAEFNIGGRLRQRAGKNSAAATGGQQSGARDKNLTHVTDDDERSDKVQGTKEEEADDDDNWVTEGEEEDTVVPQQREQVRVSKLTMLHASGITWINNQATLNHLPDAIDMSDPVYRFGGQAHRVLVDNSIEIDCMICDPTFCVQCNANADPTRQTKTDGHAFVHSRDHSRSREGEIYPNVPVGQFCFRPQPKPHGTAPKKNWPRPQYFETEEGLVKCQARVCGNVDCDICQGR